MKKGLLYAVFSTVTWGFLPLLWRIFDTLPPIYILASRIIWSFVFIGILLLISKRRYLLKQALRNRQALLRSGFSGLIISFNWFLGISAINSGHTLDTVMASFLNSLACCLAAFIFLNEKLNNLQKIAILLALSGVGVMTLQSGQIPWVALTMSSTFAIYSLLKKNILIDTIVSHFIESAIVMPIALTIILYFEITNQGAFQNLYGWRLASVPTIGIITVVPLFLYSKSVELLPLSLAGFLQYITSFISFLIAIFLFKERFSPIYIASFGFIWVALVIFIFASFNIKEKNG